MIDLLASIVFAVIGAAVATLVFWVWEGREGAWWRKYNISDKEMEEFSKEDDS